MSKYLPTKEKVFVQGRVPMDVFKAVKEIMKTQGYTWPDVLTASLKHFLDQVKGSPG